MAYHHAAIIGPAILPPPVLVVRGVSHVSVEALLFARAESLVKARYSALLTCFVVGISRDITEDFTKMMARTRAVLAAQAARLGRKVNAPRRIAGTAVFDEKAFEQERFTAGIAALGDIQAVAFEASDPGMPVFGEGARRGAVMPSLTTHDDSAWNDSLAIRCWSCWASQRVLREFPPQAHVLQSILAILVALGLLLRPHLFEGLCHAATVPA